jgi:hypothetical protein
MAILENKLCLRSWLTAVRVQVEHEHRTEPVGVKFGVTHKDRDRADGIEHDSFWLEVNIIHLYPVAWTQKDMETIIPWVVGLDSLVNVNVFKEDRGPIEAIFEDLLWKHAGIDLAFCHSLIYFITCILNRVIKSRILYNNFSLEYTRPDLESISSLGSGYGRIWASYRFSSLRGA